MDVSTQERVGAQLLQRTSRGLSLTEAGRAYCEISVRLLGEIEATESSIGRGWTSPIGLVRQRRCKAAIPRALHPALDFVPQYTCLCHSIAQAGISAGRHPVSASSMSGVTMKLYELAAQEDDRCFSPYCWRTRMALAHKGLSHETIPWRFTEKAEIAFSGQERVPVLVDGEKTVSDSWTIATYLEATYPDRPSLFGGADAQALAHFVNAWTDRVLQPAITPLIVTDILAHVHEKDRDYFRKSREQRLGRPLEEVASERDRRVLDLRRTLDPFRAIVRERTYLSGDRPMYADYIFFGAFQWARCISPFRLLEDGDPVAAWRDRMLHLHGGLGLQAKGYPV